MQKWDHDAPLFYESSLGIRTRRALNNVIQSLWPDFSTRPCKKSVFGYAWPFLRGEKINPPFVFMSHYAKAPESPKKNKEKDVQVTLCKETSLPLQSCSMDIILMIHWLEHSENPAASLRETWRVLKEEGRLLLIVPNRRSLWAQKDATPFGKGTSFSLSEIEHLLEDAFFTPLVIEGALYMPPTSSRFLQSFSPIIERFCKKRLEGGLGFFAGVWVIEASKRIYAVLPEEASSSIKEIGFESSIS